MSANDVRRTSHKLFRERGNIISAWSAREHRHFIVAFMHAMQSGRSFGQIVTVTVRYSEDSPFRKTAIVRNVARISVRVS